MSGLEFLFKDHQNTLAVSGDWYVARWSPDVATGELLNIGVYFSGTDGSSDYKILENFERISCLYSSNTVFHARLACEVAESYFSGELPMANVSLPNLRIERRGFTQGDCAEDIVERLFSTVIPLAAPKTLATNKRQFTSMSSKIANNRVRSFLKDSLATDFEKHVPRNPFVTVQDGYGKSEVYVPYIRPIKNSNVANVATIVSAAYIDTWRAKASLYDGMRDIETALELSEFDGGLLAVALPDDSLEKTDREKIMDEYSTFERYVLRSGIEVKSATSTGDLAKTMHKWLRAS